MSACDYFFLFSVCCHSTNKVAYNAALNNFLPFYLCHHFIGFFTITLQQEAQLLLTNRATLGQVSLGLHLYTVELNAITKY